MTARKSTPRRASRRAPETSEDDALDKALADTFPASDPMPVMPGSDRRPHREEADGRDEKGETAPAG